MRTAILYIAERCNQDCVFCLEMNGAWRPFVDPSTTEVTNELGRLFGRGARHITFMGGETFFRKDLANIIRHAKSLGFTRVGVTTNGTVLSKKGFIKDLLDSGLDFIEFSVHGDTPEIANEIAQTNYSFERQSSALDEINELGKPFVIVNVVVCRPNKDRLIPIADYVLKKLSNVPLRFKFKFVSVQGLAEQAAEQGEGLRYDEVDAIPVGDYLEARGVPFWFWNFPLCRLGRHAARSHDAGVLAIDESYFDFDHRNERGYFDSGHQFGGHVWPAESCGACTLKPLCPGIEEQYRRLFGIGGLAARSDDPVLVAAGAIKDRGGDPSIAAERIESLRKQPRPDLAIIERTDHGAVRFHHPDEPHDLEFSIAERTEGMRAFILTRRFALSYLPWPETPVLMARPNVAAQTEAVGHVLEAADSEEVGLDEAIGRARAALSLGWTAVLPVTPPAEAKPLVTLTSLAGAASRGTGEARTAG